MEDGPPKPEELDSLKQKVADAKLRFDFASQYVEELNGDVRSGLISALPRGRELAIRTERFARVEYLRVLKIYEDFVGRAKDTAHDGADPQGSRHRAGNQHDST